MMMNLSCPPNSPARMTGFLFQKSSRGFFLSILLTVPAHLAMVSALNIFLKSKAPLPSLPLGKGEEKGGGVNILDLASLSIADAHEFLKNLKLSEQEKEISVPVVKEIEARLQFMLDVGLDYLQLSRKANTLSGGEAQRIRLASQLGSRLVGALYVLDE